MKKLILIILSFFIITGCNKEENKVVNQSEEIKDSETNNNKDSDTNVINLKEGYYVYKLPDSWYAFVFNPDKSAQYIINYCPGQGCGGYLEEGSYTIEDGKVIATFTYSYADIEQVEIDPPRVLEFTYIDENTIQYNDMILNYQLDFN